MRRFKTCPGKVEHNCTNAISHLNFVNLLKNNDQWWQAEACLSGQAQVKAGRGRLGQVGTCTLQSLSFVDSVFCSLFMSV